MATKTERFETVIVGGGQAGLATGYHLRKRGREHVILDAGSRVGDSWRERWPSLRLYSPASTDGLPGMKFPAPSTRSRPARVRRLPGGVRGAVRAPRAEQRRGGRARPRRGALRRDGRGAPLRGRERGRRDGSHAEASNARFRRRPRSGHPAAPLFRLPEPGPAPAGRGARRRRRALGRGHRVRGRERGDRTILSGRHTGQIPINIEGLSGRLAFPMMRFLATRVLTLKTPIGRKMKPEIRSHGGPLLRVKQADLEGGRRPARVSAGPSAWRTACPCSRTAVLDVANVVWCTGFRKTTPGSACRSTSSPTATRSSGEARSRLRPVSTSWDALPALVQLDAHPRGGPRLEAGRQAHRQARRSTAAEGRRARLERHGFGPRAALGRSHERRPGKSAC